MKPNEYTASALAMLNGADIPEGVDLPNLLAEISRISDGMPDGDEARTKVLVAIISDICKEIGTVSKTLNDIRRIQANTAVIAKETRRRLDALEGRDG